MSAIGTECAFLSSYAHVLICLAENPQARLREIADRVGLTERTVMRLISQLDEAGFLKRTRRGRRNVYEIVAGEPLRHPMEVGCTLDNLLRSVLGPGEAATTGVGLPHEKACPTVRQERKCNEATRGPNASQLPDDRR